VPSKAAIASSARISVGDARRLFMHAQGLLDDPHDPPPATQAGRAAAAYRMIERLGFLQLDTISIVERAHHHILWTRLHWHRPDGPGVLDILRTRPRGKPRLFEHMTHDASLIPTRWFPHWRHRFARSTESAWLKERLGADRDRVLLEVKSRITANGPAMSRHFENEDEQTQTGAGQNGSPGGWWEWRPHKAALEHLWRKGELTVAQRINFQKVYDLTERALPHVHSLPAPDEEAHTDWACRTALERLAVATPAELAAFWRAIPIARAAAWCRAMHTSGEVIPVLVESADGSKPRAAYAPANWRSRLARAPEPRPALRLLSPFDPILRDRARAKRLFNFDYRFEAFTPAPRRKYGYYVLPILEGDRLIGRLDAKTHREHGMLQVLGLWWEPRIAATRERQRRLGDALDNLAQFVGVQSWSMNGPADQK
jgi:uncharacterized protein YcaQ